MISSLAVSPSPPRRCATVGATVTKVSEVPFICEIRRVWARRVRARTGEVYATEGDLARAPVSSVPESVAALPVTDAFDVSLGLTKRRGYRQRTTWLHPAL